MSCTTVRTMSTAQKKEKRDFLASLKAEKSCFLFPTLLKMGTCALSGFHK